MEKMIATKAKMLGVFKEKLVNAPKELNNPASLNSCAKPKLSHEVVKDFMSCNKNGFVIYDNKNGTVFVASGSNA
ncbi:unnamed protein product [Sphenostylis stenocarpa]|uniref:Uncharacterized protein n=1 Tax=Sphenostylis stenocarpa TaxID=92480 RepID=A0AA86SZ97_9FABA|nr:unnamed protein product [Sphenostylis stenocarpa]